jgi:hypothetical protein
MLREYVDVQGPQCAFKGQSEVQESSLSLETAEEYLSVGAIRNHKYLGKGRTWTLLT